jgi:hypothetical protein
VRRTGPALSIAICAGKCRNPSLGAFALRRLRFLKMTLVVEGGLLVSIGACPPCGFSGRGHRIKEDFMAALSAVD